MGADRPMRTMCREFEVCFRFRFGSRKGWAVGERGPGLLPGTGGWQPAGWEPVTSWALGRVWLLGRGRSMWQWQRAWSQLMSMPRGFGLASHLEWSEVFRGAGQALRTCPWRWPGLCQVFMIHVEPSSPERTVSTWGVWQGGVRESLQNQTGPAAALELGTGPLRLPGPRRLQVCSMETVISSARAGPDGLMQRWRPGLCDDLMPAYSGLSDLWVSWEDRRRGSRRECHCASTRQAAAAPEGGPRGRAGSQPRREEGHWLS